jgi:hypothetical protein
MDVPEIKADELTGVTNVGRHGDKPLDHRLFAVRHLGYTSQSG